jgi:uncharacterized protein YjbI with pentapeptide repeats
MMHARPSATALEELILEHERWAGTLSGTGRQLVLEDTDLAGVDLAGRDLTEVYLGGSRLVGARLDGAHLVDTDLRGADLTGALLERALLEGTRLGGARLHGARGVDRVVVYGPIDAGMDAREWRSGSEALDWLVRQAQQPPE